MDLTLRRSLRLQLVILVVLCAVFALVLPLPINLADVRWHHTNREYARGMERIDTAAQALAHALDEPGRAVDAASLRSLADGFASEVRSTPIAARVVDRDGHVVLATEGAATADVDISSALREAAAQRSEPERYDGRGEYAVVYAVTQRGAPGYLVVAGTPRRQHAACPVRYVTSGAWPFLFVGLFFLGTRRKLDQLRTIGEGLSAIAAGRLEHRLPARGEDELGLLARDVNAMADALQRNIEAERRAERTKDELIAHVSHDLRTPLTSIMGYLDLLRRRRYDGPVQLAQYVDVAHGKAEQLHRMIEDLFEYARLCDPRLRLARQRVNVDELVAQLASEYVPLCEGVGLALHTELPAGHVSMEVDPDRLVRVLDNLLSNALKYSDAEGRVELRLCATGDRVQITVENTGPALSPGDLERLFERFFRADAARSSAVRGSGLGLAIARSIVALHGGDIWGESDPGVVRFHVRLPRTAGELGPAM